MRTTHGQLASYDNVKLIILDKNSPNKLLPPFHNYYRGFSSKTKTTIIIMEQMEYLFAMLIIQVI